MPRIWIWKLFGVEDLSLEDTKRSQSNLLYLRPRGRWACYRGPPVRTLGFEDLGLEGIGLRGFELGSEDQGLEGARLGGLGLGPLEGDKLQRLWIPAQTSSGHPKPPQASPGRV